MYSKCSTCRKAMKWLDEAGIAYESLPIRKTPPSIIELKHALRHLVDLKKIFNTSGMDYRAMNIKEKLTTLSENEALELLSKHGNLIKRPLVIGKNIALAGFRPDQWQNVLGE